MHWQQLVHTVHSNETLMHESYRCCARVSKTRKQQQCVVIRYVGQKAPEEMQLVHAVENLPRLQVNLAGYIHLIDGVCHTEACRQQAKLSNNMSSCRELDNFQHTTSY